MKSILFFFAFFFTFP
ncbi:pheA operon leader peptide PheL [Pseudocitrobacter cyperus]|uniref:PheA operon leader peptide PheL n=1 Tax=Pseudocitrobacter cyperus TaxID=3112843 RepID=A0ABV0HKD3_9ENTR